MQEVFLRAQEREIERSEVDAPHLVACSFGAFGVGCREGAAETMRIRIWMTLLGASLCGTLCRHPACSVDRYQTGGAEHPVGLLLS
jgi:hypothetical protein